MVTDEHAQVISTQDATASPTPRDCERELGHLHKSHDGSPSSQAFDDSAEQAKIPTTRLKLAFGLLSANLRPVGDDGAKCYETLAAKQLNEYGSIGEHGSRKRLRMSSTDEVTASSRGNLSLERSSFSHSSVLQKGVMSSSVLSTSTLPGPSTLPLPDTKGVEIANFAASSQDVGTLSSPTKALMDEPTFVDLEWEKEFVQYYNFYLASSSHGPSSPSSEREQRSSGSNPPTQSYSHLPPKYESSMQMSTYQNQQPQAPQSARSNSLFINGSPTSNHQISSQNASNLPPPNYQTKIESTNSIQRGADSLMQLLCAELNLMRSQHDAQLSRLSAIYELNHRHTQAELLKQDAELKEQFKKDTDAALAAKDKQMVKAVKLAKEEAHQAYQKQLYESEANFKREYQAKLDSMAAVYVDDLRMRQRKVFEAVEKEKDAQVEIKSLSERLQACEAKLVQLTESHGHEIRRLSEKMEGDLRNRESQLEEWRKKEHLALDNVKSLSQRLKEAEAKLRQEAQKVEESEAVVERLQSEKARVSSDMEERLRVKETQLNESKQKEQFAQSAFENIKTASQRLEMQLEEERRTMEARLSEFKQKERLASDNISTLRLRLKEAEDKQREEAQNHATYVEEAKAAMDHLRLEKKGVVKDMEAKLQAQALQLGHLKNSSSEEITRLKQRLEQADIELREGAQKHVDYMEESKVAMECLRSEKEEAVTNMEEKLRDKEAKLRDKKSQLEKLERSSSEHVAALTRRLEEVEERLREETQREAESKLRLEEKLRATEAELSESKQKGQLASDTIENLRRGLEELEKKQREEDQKHANYVEESKATMECLRLEKESVVNEMEERLRAKQSQLDQVQVAGLDHFAALTRRLKEADDKLREQSQRYSEYVDKSKEAMDSLRLKNETDLNDMRKAWNEEKRALEVRLEEERWKLNQKQVELQAKKAGVVIMKYLDNSQVEQVLKTPERSPGHSQVEKKATLHVMEENLARKKAELDERERQLTETKAKLEHDRLLFFNDVKNDFLLAQKEESSLTAKFTAERTAWEEERRDWEQKLKETAIHERKQGYLSGYEKALIDRAVEKSRLENEKSTMAARSQALELAYAGRCAELERVHAEASQRMKDGEKALIEQLNMH
ncbi:hypothetical protein D9613_009200 [Agrocybe pediades]|uniref:Uncharacterized protein n=1 Tax=Agrocybe pediades TaxID=84607 RepID=A0A8H4R3N7_9AGAR|nr:hypothetical protein D9613_009200 [Agrocybe pediades]